jgi:hypothetical protein
VACVVSKDRLLQGFVMNMQPSEAEVGFDLRLPPTEDIEQIKRRVEEEWAPSHKNLTYEVNFFISAVVSITGTKQTESC